MTIEFREFFHNATVTHYPYPYQEKFAENPSTVLSVPTGAGKTETVVLAWLYRYLTNPAQTPKRLVYVLPTRTLVESTRDRIDLLLKNLGAHFTDLPETHLVMGGDAGQKWMEQPELPAIIIGTQDMLLSRALNRGYGMKRFIWPMTFGALNNDVQWAIDEVQLQGIGAVTATQLHAFRQRFGTYKPAELVLLSATLDQQWFATADYSLDNAPVIKLEAPDLADERLRKRMNAPKSVHAIKESEPRGIVAHAISRHRPGTLTLIILNRVERAKDVYLALRKAGCSAETVLLHSRFREQDRKPRLAKITGQIESSGSGVIAVTTQVIEAGIDVSAATLITDLAPWSSIVQRFGRCNRTGNETDAQCFWITELSGGKDAALPYELEELSVAREELQKLEGRTVTPNTMETLPIPLPNGSILRKPELFDLFDTSLDLAGHDLDIAPFIRDAKELHAQVFWRIKSPDKNDVPQRKELCTAALSQLHSLWDDMRKRQGDERTKKSPQLWMRTRNHFAKNEDAAWSNLTKEDIRPGALICICTDVGGYNTDLGFGTYKSPVDEIDRKQLREPTEGCTMDSDELTNIGVAVSLFDHARDTAAQFQQLRSSLNLDDPMAHAAHKAALWHDVGKAHPAFQETMQRGNAEDASDDEQLTQAGIADDDEASNKIFTNSPIDVAPTIWAKSRKNVRHKDRVGFRHELPGALTYLHAHDAGKIDDLIAFLIAAHHGRVRMAALCLPYEASQKEPALLGNQEGDIIPAFTLSKDVHVRETRISLAAFQVGTTDEVTTWVERMAALRDDPKIGPFRLAYLELLVRLADWRSSKVAQELGVSA